MTKRDFLGQLRKGLSGLPQSDLEERLIFYSEMIDDRMEEGLTEEEAVSAVGSVAEILAQVLSEAPHTKIQKETVPPKRRLRGWEILLLILGSPVWLSLGIAALAVIVSFYISLWAVIISLWSVFAAFVGCAVGGILGCVILVVGGNHTSGMAMLAAGIVCAGLSVFVFCGCKVATTGTLLLTKKTVIRIKNSLIKKETSQ